MKTYPFNSKILTRFFEGSLPEKEHLEVLHWLSSLPAEEQQNFLEAHLAVLEESVLQQKISKDTSEQEVSLKQEILSEKEVLLTEETIASAEITAGSAGFEELVIRIRKKEKNKIVRSVLRIAAVTLPFLLMWFFFKQTSIQPAVVTARHQVIQPRFIQVKNTTDRINTVQLPDSSSVALYPQASIGYDKTGFKNKPGFGGKKREIQLTGKAFFKVRHDIQSPFTVKTGLITTVVLGTSFWVDASENTGRISVRVKTGKVGVVHADRATVFLLPKEKAVFNQSNGVLVSFSTANPPKSVVTAVQPATAIAFNETPLKQVMKVLAENFKTEISLSDSLQANLPVSLNTRGKTMTDILEEIKSQIPIDYEIKGKRITITKKE